MTQALKIDTLAFSKRLKEAGADDRLAEAIVEGITAADTSDLATKADIAETKTEVLKWMFGMMVAQAGFVIAVIKFL